MDLVGVVLKPKAWPSYRYQVSELKKALGKINEWSLKGVSARTNRNAEMVAKSVTVEMKYQSYVASGGPFWLREVLDNEKQGCQS